MIGGVALTVAGIIAEKNKNSLIGLGIATIIAGGILIIKNNLDDQ